MAQVINTNIMSLNAQRNLNNTTSALSSVVQRLSSGLRINSAKDDAAGLAIASRFSTQIRGQTVAARNANDGISLAQTAEGALGEITENLQRIRELAVQSRNATNSVSDRAALDAEVQQLKAEIGRVANQTNFNGISLLDGTFAAQAFQVGANQGQTISIDGIVNANTNQLGVWQMATSAPLAAIATPDQAVAAQVNGVDIGLAAESGRTAAQALEQLVASFNAAKATGVAGLQNVTMNDDGSMISTAVITGGGVISGAALDNQTGFAALNVTDVLGADQMILAMDGALTAINTARADLGAIQNRFTSVVRSLDVSVENLSDSRSRIMDTDYAKETSELTRTQILQQAGTAMLAQAKALPQSVLQLLQ